MKTNSNEKYQIFRRVEEEIKETAAEIYSGLSLEEKEEGPAELAEQYEEEITQRVYQLLDNFVIYYYDSAEIVLNFGHYNGWEELQILGGEAPTNISQLAYAVIYEELVNEGILYGYSWAFEEVKEEVTTITQHR
jgi:hypothetical protein